MVRTVYNPAMRPGEHDNAASPGQFLRDLHCFFFALMTAPRDRFGERQTVGYPRSAVAYPRSAAGYPLSVVRCPPPAVGYPSAVVGRPPNVQLGLMDASTLFFFPA